VTPDHAYAIQVHIDIEFEHLGDRGVGYIEVGVVSEVMKGWEQGVICVRKTLGRELSHEWVRPQDVGVGSGAADIELGRFSRG